jgi:hypothetical protein
MLMSMSAIGTSAWTLQNIKGAPGSVQKYTDLVGSYSSSSRSSISESCNYYVCSTHYDGSIAYAKYTMYAIKSDGTKLSNLCGTRYHYSTGSSTVSFNKTVPGNSTVYGQFTLMNYADYNSQIYGTLG